MSEPDKAPEYIVELWPIEKALPYARNPRRNDDAVDRMAASIREFGFRMPILARSTGDIVDGHLRLKAARALGLTEVPVLIVDDLSDTQIKAFRLLVNRSVNWARFDKDRLKIELQALLAEAYNLALTGFDPDELKRLLAEPDAPDRNGDDAPPAPAVATSRPGDVWLLGDHRVVCGDSTSEEAYSALFEPGELAACVFTDPPYNVNYANAPGAAARGKSRAILNDNMGADFPAFLRAALKLLVDRSAGGIYICMSTSEVEALQAAWQEAGGHFATYIVWAKNTFTIGRSDYQRQYEPILYGWRAGIEPFWGGGRTETDLWEIPKPHRNEMHPTMKPVELCSRAIRNSSRPGELVLDAFGGSGSTLIACEDVQRRARLIELDPKYVDVIVMRWEAYARQKAVLQATGASFEDTKSARISPKTSIDTGASRKV